MCIRDKKAKSPGPSHIPFRDLWKKIWNAPTHTRIKHFLWRLANNILPTKLRLRQKGIELEETCYLCQREAESAFHLFSQCDFTRRVFFASVLGYHFSEIDDLNDWLLAMLSNNNVCFVQVTCYLLHHIWKACNLKLYEQKRCDPVRVAMDAWDAVMEINLHTPTRAKDAGHARINTISAPADEFHTVRVDAGLGENDVMTFGCVIMDQNKIPIVSLCKRENCISNPGLAECLALRWSIETAAKLNIHKVIFHSDAKAMVDCVNGVTKDASFEMVAEDFRILMKSFSNSCIMFIPRKFNYQAHDLAQLAKSMG
ncbi:uncharacterized protein LOC131605614 [Vicia villosa]|uniref:uncharacterized protein LOC131605614 n=1 Tax=Vicia villosa TaxID=3911 RepID=UPI00273CC630|nr:uncharacterized protein LOC131605614 [Vicia villosa]